MSSRSYAKNRIVCTPEWARWVTLSLTKTYICLRQDEIHWDHQASTPESARNYAEATAKCTSEWAKILP